MLKISDFDSETIRKAKKFLASQIEEYFFPYFIGGIFKFCNKSEIQRGIEEGNELGCEFIKTVIVEGKSCCHHSW